MRLRENEGQSAQFLKPLGQMCRIVFSLGIHMGVGGGGGLCGIKLLSLDPNAPLSLDAGKEFTENIHRAPFGFYFLRADGGHGQSS